MKLILSFFKVLFIFMFLTLISQVGGIVYLIYKPFSDSIKNRIRSKGIQLIFRVILFLGMMSLSSFMITPFIAKQFGRVPLPLQKTENLNPGNLLFCFLNRHYVKPELLNSIKEISKEVKATITDTEIIYLDANFPFYDGFPLLPHRSHDDGEKLDIAFIYKDIETGKRLNSIPSFIGYGYSEGPREGEFDQISDCEAKGYWQYGLISKITGQKKRYQFDEAANQQLLQIIIKNPQIGKVFIEPHLKQRLGFSNASKVRFHGCAAVRHDDHIHIQL